MQTPPPGTDFLPPETFAGQVAVVTGGGTGLGLEISRGLAALGADVTILSRDPSHHTALLDEGRERGWAVHARSLDVRESKDVARVARELLADKERVDILVNNAAGNFVCPSERLSFNAWRAVLGIVLDGTFYCSREFGRSMIDGDGGQILNIVATYAWTGMPGVVHSASAKAGVLAMTKTLAAEWARHGIRVNAIAPGPFHSDGAAGNLWPDEEWAETLRAGIPLGRFGTAQEIAAQCLWQLSPHSSWMTGECLVVDGGGSLPKPWWSPGKRPKRPRSTEEGEGA
ncbi:MAG TPA: SDR family oxidoreductase [Planctomycetes bacterium]|nr:SDR family oxidoreductase [Planctomycetota bacterium]